ncbi:hypothetical protein [uncultured Bradyrhizobium sp.]|uniref:protein kinase domain-containing protein n=1 Tax=uncultured Bradyrhizobium sp. TaxID=199684 RepID=UPI002627314F|nr:hypothetical protein [uncultured Bradyrhizobium sp.]
MNENMLIRALQSALEGTGADHLDGHSGSQSLATELTKALDGLSKPTDPTEALSPLEFWLRSTVATATFDQSELQGLTRLYEALASTGCSAATEGAIGFLLCCRSADQAQTVKAGRASVMSPGDVQRAQSALANASEYLASSAVRGWIASYYGIDRSKVVDPHAEVTMIASGTTSYVIRYGGSANFVFKLVKPQFMGSALIRDQTSSYGSLLRNQAATNPLLPRVLAAGGSFVQMEFIEGSSLADIMERGDLDNMTVDERREVLFGIIGNLEALRSPHLDLSPGNIMIEPLPVGRDKIRRFKVRLIDFGYNYLLREGLSGLPIRSDIVRYSAPEMMAGAYEGSTKADLYSLGMVVLDVMRPSANAVDLSVQLDRLWQVHSQLASIVEELVAVDPYDRASWSNGLDQPTTYGVLRRRLEQEEQITKLIDTRVEVSAAWGGFEPLVQQIMKIVRELPTLWKLTDKDPYSANAKYLYYWGALINTSIVASLVYCGYKLFQTVHPADAIPENLWSLSAWVKGVLNKLNATLFGPTEVQSVIAGQTLAFAIVLVVSQYYNSIFSSITTRSVRTYTARWAERTMRFTPFGIMLLCVSTAGLFPSWWYVTSLIGPLITAGNNFAVWRFCQSTRQDAAGRSIAGNLETTDITRFDETFSGWWKSMIGTGVFIFAVGLLLRFGPIHDEAFLGVVMALLCYYALHKYASTDMGALVRGGIRRYVKVAERMQAAARQRGTAPPAELRLNRLDSHAREISTAEL